MTPIIDNRKPGNQLGVAAEAGSSMPRTKRAAHRVADKRADISVARPARKILCELKRDYHAEVWAVPMGQLERFYAHDL
jgi:hypothetical protein